MVSITLEQASDLIDYVFEAGRKRNLKPLSAAVVDMGGALVAYKREDGASFLRFDLAYGKAYAAVAIGFTSSAPLAGFFEKKKELGDFIKAASDGKLLADPGGIRIFDNEGNELGAIGVTGDISAADEECAIAAIKRAGLDMK